MDAKSHMDVTANEYSTPIPDATSADRDDYQPAASTQPDQDQYPASADRDKHGGSGCNGHCDGGGISTTLPDRTISVPSTMRLRRRIFVPVNAQQVMQNITTEIDKLIAEQVARDEQGRIYKQALEEIYTLARTRHRTDDYLWLESLRHRVIEIAREALGIS